MFLKSIKYCRFNEQQETWSMEGKPQNGEKDPPVTFQNINLVVGKNATGKSKAINIIHLLSNLIAGYTYLSEVAFSASYETLFDNNGNKINYFLAFENGKVKKEKLIINDVVKLERTNNEGKMYYEKISMILDFEMESNKLAVSRVDSLQQPFFEPLQKWGKKLRLYQFGSTLGKDKVFGIEDFRNIASNNLLETVKKDDISLLILLSEAEKKNVTLKNQVVNDMRSIGYDLENIGHQVLRHEKIGMGLIVAVQEKDVIGATNQLEMSQGMFRALSLLIQLNYSLLNHTSTCILIDDIGEGLDYERAKSLIDLVIEKVKGSTTVQVIMTTNDRYVMNNVPLEYWSVIHRVPQKSLFYNYENSTEIFDEFKYSGLSNFDFLKTEFYTAGFETEENATTL